MYVPNFNDLINKPGQHSFSTSYSGTKNAPSKSGSGYSGSGSGGYGGGGYGGGSHGSVKTAKQTEEFMLNELFNQLGK